LVGAILDKVVGPDMIALLRPQPNARSVGQPEPAALGLLMRDLQPLASPDALDPLVVDYPACLAQQPCDLAIAIAAVLLGKLDNIGRQTLLVLTAARHLALRRAMPPPAERDKLLSIDLNSSIDVLAKVKPDETRPEVFALAVDPNKKMAATLSWFPSNNLP